MESSTYVPFCTCKDGLERELRMRGAGIDVLESTKHVSRKIAIFSVLHFEEGASADSSDFNGERGIYISTTSAPLHDQDAVALVCILRRVDLHTEPFWGSLLLLLSTHMVVAKTGPLTASSFHMMSFLSDFLQIQATEHGKPEDNALLLKEFVPKFTWAAIDLKIKDMEGCESPTKYFEQKLMNPSRHGFDMDAQMIMNGYLHTRDCIVVKSNTLQQPAGFAYPQAFTSSKAIAHALENAQVKPFFGRYMDGSLFLHLCRSLAHSMSSQTKLVLQRMVNNVLLGYWKILVNSAFEKYCDVMHARLTVYEKVEFTAEYLVDITERKLQNQQVAVVNAGQGSFSAFDEFGNLLKRQTSTDSADGVVPSSTASPNASSFNTGIFSFLKERAERAFTKQFSLLGKPTSSSLSDSNAGTGLPHIPENDEGDEDRVSEHHRLSSVHDTPDQLLAKYNAPIKSYSVPVQYMHTPSESMPMDASQLEKIHREALNDVKEIILPFLFDLRCTTIKYSELVCTVNFYVGKKNLFRRINEVKRKFERANLTASALFCAELIRYLHGVVLRKNESDNLVKLKELPRVNRATSSIIPLSTDPTKNEPPLTKLPFELLTYKNNLEAMISQYNFVARGPLASKIIIGFFEGPVRSRLIALTQKEYQRFSRACDEKEEKVTELEESLEAKQQQVQIIMKTNQEYSRQEMEAVAEIERSYGEQAEKLNSSIRSASDMVERALRDQQSLYQSTMQATRKTIKTIDKVAEKSRVSMGYLERYEKGHMFSKSWRQYYFVLDHATLTCYKSKSAYEERGPPCERPICLTGYSVVKSRTDDLKIKLIPPEAGAQMLRFRAPASVGRETWMKRFIEATQHSRS